MPTEPIADVAETSAWADEHTVTFRLADPGHELAGVRLAHAFHPYLTELLRPASR